MSKAQERALYALECLCHVAWLLPDSVRRKPDSARRCRACSQAGSKLWRAAVTILQAWVVGLGLLAFECVLIPGLPKRFDIYLVFWNIAVEVDGAQHFHGWFYDTPAADQWAWDRHVDAECRRVGQRLVRLHYADMHEWASTVQRALTSQATVIYTSSYGL